MLKKRVMATSFAVAVIGLSATAHASFFSVAELLRTMQAESTAWVIQVKQTALATSQRNDATLRATQSVSTANASISQSNHILDATRDFSGRFGQPDGIKCAAQADRVMLIEMTSQKDRDLSMLMQSYSASRVGSQAAANSSKLTTRKTSYCTQDEAKAGICNLKPNGMQAWDTNYAGAFNERTLAPETELAGYEFVAMIADNRSSLHSDCKSTSCDAAAHQAHAATAFSSMAAFALAGQIADRRMPVLAGAE